MKIIDTTANTVSAIPCLKAQEIGTVIRYYNFSNSRTFPNKRMELAEAQALSANGFKIAAVFQQRQNQIADFSRTQGVAAGRRAYRFAHDNIGQPEGSGIYFSVDFDASKREIDNSIIPYFEGVKTAFDEESDGHPQYRVGVYSSGLVSSTLFGKELIELIWLAMSRGFRGTQAALNRGEFHLAQLFPERTICGLDVDFNDPNPDRPDFGAFTIEDDVAKNDTNGTVGTRHKVIARGGLRLREGPGTQFEIIGGLQFGQIVFVESAVDGFARVDVEGDGKIDGFASIGFLQRV